MNIKKLSKINLGIIVSTILISIIYFFINLIEENYAMVLFSVGAVTFPFAIYVVEAIIKPKISETIKFIYLTFVFLSMSLGNIVDLYDRTVGFDKFVHFISGLLISILAVLILKQLKIKLKTGILIMYIILFNSAVAALWEITEYLVDIIFKANTQKGLVDTMQDMIYALMGCVIYLFIYINKKIKHTN